VSRRGPDAAPAAGAVRRQSSDWLVVGAEFAIKAAVMGEVATQTKGLTTIRAAGVILGEVIAPNEASEIMAGIALRSAGRTLLIGLPFATAASAGVQAELYLYDRVVTSTANDIYTVLSRSRAGW